MHKTDLYEEKKENSHQDYLEKQGSYQQLRQFARLFLHIGLLPLAYALWSVISKSSNFNFFDSEVFSLSFWFLACLFVVVISFCQKSNIRDSGLRTFYMLAVTAVSLMLALNMTGIIV